MTNTTTATAPAYFLADLQRLNTEMHRLDAVITFDDGFVGIDPTKVPDALMRIYCNLTALGQTKGWL